jgi:hypothetical protein
MKLYCAFGDESVAPRELQGGKLVTRRAGGW